MRIQTHVTGLLLVGLLSVPAFAAHGTPPPAITVQNNASTASTVKVVTGPYQACAGSSNFYNAAKSPKVIGGMTIDMFCGDQFPCDAEVYLGDAHDCNGSAIGKVELLRDGTINVLSVAVNHQMSGGKATITIDY